MTFRVWERIRDWVLLFSLLASALGIMLAQNTAMVRALRATALETTSWVEARFAWVGGYFRALEENNQLRSENIYLSSQVARTREAQIENSRLRRLLGFRDTTSLDLTPAQIVSKDITEKYLLTIDVGSADGVDVGMAVVDDRGIIGKIVLVSPNYSRVMPYLNPDFRVPVRVLPIMAEGNLRWEGVDRSRLLLEHVSRTEQVLRGQLVVTSGYSASFPAGFPVGFVDSVSTQPGRNELQISVVPTSPIDEARYVFVVKDNPDPERIELEEEVIR